MNFWKVCDKQSFKLSPLGRKGSEKIRTQLNIKTRACKENLQEDLHFNCFLFRESSILRNFVWNFTDCFILFFHFCNILFCDSTSSCVYKSPPDNFDPNLVQTLIWCKQLDPRYTNFYNLNKIHCNILLTTNGSKQMENI